MKKLILLKPYGWCSGVEWAIKKFEEIKRKFKDHDIYVLGDLIHNKYSLTKIKESNIHFVNTKNQTIFLNKLNNKDAVIVFPAHGCKTNVLNHANKKFKYVFKLTCPCIENNIKLAQDLVKKNKKVYFFGKKGHAETECILSMNNSIEWTFSFNEINKVSKPAYLINQSTIPTYIFNKNIKNANITYIPTTCRATNTRYKNILNLPTHVNLLIVIGDKNSFNTQMLLRTSKTKTVLIQSISDLKLINFKHINTCAITSGTSTPKEMINEIISNLRRLIDFRN